MERRKLLVVEDDPGIRRQLRWFLEEYDVVFAIDRKSALAELRRHEPPVVLQDLGLPPQPSSVEEGMATLREMLVLAPMIKVIVVTGHGERPHAIEAIGSGAHDFYEKPLDLNTLQVMVTRAFYLYDLERANRIQTHGAEIDGMLASSDIMKRACRLVEKVAPTDATALLLGESGTGKELMARAIHRLSVRHDGPFVAINCAAIPEALLEAELFGYEKGAFTGAMKQTPGKIEYANRGTLFLDEIGDMPMSLQAKMLRFLQERMIERVGGRSEISVDVRVVCATNQDLKVLLNEGRFRDDLYYRISEVTITIPPLRERDGDAVMLAREFLVRKGKGHKVRGFSDGAISAIRAYHWPGNVRELENRVKSAIIMAEGKYLSAKDLGLDGYTQQSTLPLNLRQIRQQAEKVALDRALAIAGGNISKSSELLGITRPTFYDLLKKHTKDA